MSAQLVLLCTSSKSYSCSVTPFFELVQHRSFISLKRGQQGTTFFCVLPSGIQARYCSTSRNPVPDVLPAGKPVASSSALGGKGRRRAEGEREARQGLQYKTLSGSNGAGWSRLHVHEADLSPCLFNQGHVEILIKQWARYIRLVTCNSQVSLVSNGKERFLVMCHFWLNDGRLVPFTCRNLAQSDIKQIASCPVGARRKEHTIFSEMGLSLE